MVAPPQPVERSVSLKRKLPIERPATVADPSTQADTAPATDHGGQVGAWHALIEGRFGTTNDTDPVERAVAAISRWSGPVIFVASLGAVIAWIS